MAVRHRPGKPHRHICRPTSQIDDFSEALPKLGDKLIHKPLVRFGEIRTRVCGCSRSIVHDFRFENSFHTRALNSLPAGPDSWRACPSPSGDFDDVVPAAERPKNVAPGASPGLRKSADT